jgi:hypothetical protein
MGRQILGHGTIVLWARGCGREMMSAGPLFLNIFENAEAVFRPTFPNGRWEELRQKQTISGELIHDTFSRLEPDSRQGVTSHPDMYISAFELLLGGWFPG